jgi:NADH dehydrogenase
VEKNPKRPGAERPHVVIMGGGFGGLYAARALAGDPVRVTLVDRKNHHLFQPLLYQVATAALNPSDIAAPIRSILRRQKNVEVLLAEANAVDTQAKTLRLADAELAYDYLILAPGVTHSYFGNDAWSPHAPGLKTLEDALAIRRRVFLAYEAAEREADPEKRRAWLTFAIIGGGPTGVEMAGALAEIARHTVVRDFRHVDPRTARVVLIEAQPRLLPGYPESLSWKAREQLDRLGVDVWKGTRVTAIDERGVTLGEERLAARTVIWAAGVQASPLARSLGVPLDRAGRVLVNPDLTIPGHPEVFVVGDLAALEQDEKPVPGVCPAAIQAGRHAATNVRRGVRGEPYRPFRYVDKGSFAVVGRGAAVGQLRGGLKLSGFASWLAWLGIHIFFLIGFRNRLLVMINWAYSYFTYRRGARLITGETPPLLK